MATYSLKISHLRFTAGLLLFSAVASAQLRITTSSVPVAGQYQSYSTTLTATNGTPPYTWSVVSSTGVSLPEGMSLNPATGVVSATQVNGQGGYAVTLQVADSGSPAPSVVTATINFGVTSDSSYGGCQMFPPDSIYNQRIDRLPVDTTPSHQIPSSYLGSPLHPDFGVGFYPDPSGIPFMRVPANQPLINVNLATSGQIDANGTYSWPFPAWPNAVIEGTSYGTANHDHHILILQSSVNSITGPQTGPCTLYETYQSTAVPSMYNAGSNTWFMVAGLHYVLNSDEIAASASTLDNGAQDSPGIPIVPLLMRYSEVPLGVQHPLRISFPSPTNGWVWPGTGCCGGSGPPQGLLYRLKAGVNWQATCPVNLYPQAATVLQTLQQYGAYMSDHGGTGYVGGVPDIRWDDNDLACIKKLHVSDLEVVDNSALEVSAISGQTKPYVVPATLPNGTVGTAYTATISAVGGNPASRQWLVSSGTLPPGLLLAVSTGVISGTITSSAGSPFSFGITVTDTGSGRASQTQAFSLVVPASSDTTPPSVSITAPIASTTVSNTITVTATASDNVAVGDVQFQLDGVNLGADLTAAPYSISWDTTTASNGSHTLTAIARDTSHNPATSAAVPVTVSNTVTGPPTVGLIGYWNFDEASGSVAHDTSGSGHNGAVTGAAWTTGKINSGLSFNGTTNFVVTPNIAMGATFSVSAWVNPGVTTQGGYVRIAETQYSPGFYLGTNASGAGYKVIVNGGGGATGSCGAGYGCAEGGVITSGWHLVTATFDGTTARLYVDNAVVGSDTFLTPPNTNLPLYVGRYYGGSGNGWNGAIDEVRLYSQALTSAGVSAIYNYTGGPSDSTPPSVSITAPISNATVSNTITVTATASDNVAVGDVQFRLDGVNLGADLTTAPYSISWNTTTASNGSHSLTAIARDTSHNTATSVVVPVTVNNGVVGPPTVGLIGYWNFDEGSGSIAHDTSGSGYNGVVSGATWGTGKINSGLSFNGTTNYVVTPNIALGTTFSISAWVNSGGAAQGGYVRIAETQYSPGFYLGTNASGTGYKVIVNGGGGATGTCGAGYGCAEGGVVTSGWHLVTATFDGTTARLYVDNAVAGSDTFLAPPNTNLPLYIGRYYGGSSNGWNGTIDEVRLYSRALTAVEIGAIFNH